LTEGLSEVDARLLGSSDESGEIVVPIGDSTIQMVSIKSGENILARVPVIPGLGGDVVLHLPDDEIRLQAAARLAALREELIDVVARRNIYMARVRRQIDDQNFEAAGALMKELEDLPGTTRFRQALDREARLYRSTDAQVQQRIEQLFAATEVALAKFLDPRPISELRDELQQAQAGGSNTAIR
jgi:hypothetical protein